MREWACGALVSDVWAFAAISASAAAVEHRCGWIGHPTPGTWWHRDRSGHWLLAEPGGYAAANLDALPDTSTAGWVATDGSHGDGCGCLDVRTGSDRRIIGLVSAHSLPSGACRTDRHPPPP